jgi:tetratricopeptide (TPR) repeat protein
MVSERAVNVVAYSAYLIGKERMALRTQPDLEAAREQFEKSLQLDPEYAPDHALLAHTWLLLEQERYGGRDIEKKDVDATVSPHLARALELAPDLPEAVAIQGLHDLRRYRYDEAEQAFNRAIALNPNYALAYTWRAEVAYNDKRYLDMLADKEKAYALDPMSLEVASDLATEYRSFWRPQDAQRVIDRMFDLHPDHPMAYEAALGNLANHGRHGETALMLEKALAAHPENDVFQQWNGWQYLYLGMYREAYEAGDDQVKMVAALMQGDIPAADELLREGMASDPRRWTSLGRWLYEVDTGEGASEQLRRYLDLDIARMNEEGFPWQERCMPYIINDLRQVGRGEETDRMMLSCQKEVEERFKAQYLCPCTWFRVVQYTILDGRKDEAVQRVDQWLSNGDSSFDLHLDTIFTQLEDRPEYAGFLARNAAQLERQREIYLAGKAAQQDEAVAGG